MAIPAPARDPDSEHSADAGHKHGRKHRSTSRNAEGCQSQTKLPRIVMTQAQALGQAKGSRPNSEKTAVRDHLPQLPSRTQGISRSAPLLPPVSDARVTQEVGGGHAQADHLHEECSEKREMRRGSKGRHHDHGHKKKDPFLNFRTKEGRTVSKKAVQRFDDEYIHDCVRSLRSQSVGGLPRPDASHSKGSAPEEDPAGRRPKQDQNAGKKGAHASVRAKSELLHLQELIQRSHRNLSISGPEGIDALLDLKPEQEQEDELAGVKSALHSLFH